MRRRELRVSAALLSVLLLAGCGKSASLTAELTPRRTVDAQSRDNGQQETQSQDNGKEETVKEQSQGSRQQEAAKAAVMDFSVELLRSCGEDENILLSPVSVLCALGMAESGARGATREQMESVFGVEEESMNQFLGSYIRELPSGKNYKLHIADSIWLNESKEMKMEEDFLQTNVDNYDAEIYMLPFDNKAKEQVNGWVMENTDKMIPELLSEMNPNAAAYLINAVAFDAKWQEPYRKDQISQGIFTTEDGREQNVKVMYGEEFHYLEGDNETGFAKYYEGRGEDKSYAFVALLPEEGLSMEDYLGTLTGEELSGLLENESPDAVLTMLPKFQTEYGRELGGDLADMGMSDAFDAELADFTGMGTCADGNLYISKVIHKTCMAVDEAGTRAGAATAVEYECGAAMMVKEVYLNRPFVYMIVDCENHIPLFLGVMQDMESK
ncbi:MAG: serpin family protein [Blautia sp.]|nr:serpin family protein [Blautia sp.]